MQAVVFNTSGDGYWSNVARAVTITDIVVNAEDREFGELQVYFDTATWDVNVHGLIYTDKGFMTDLRNFLALHGLDNLDVEYSEQGMQDEQFVSLDVGADFIAAWEAKFGELAIAE
jgi:hypothetical protein